MFGFQRIGDLVWAAGDMRCRGFLIGGTAGRTTLNGEGLQHQDGHSHLLAHTNPRVVPYDPSFAYELGVIVRDGIRRMAGDGEDVMFYLTVGNEPYAQPAMPDGAEDGILRGLYPFRKGSKKKAAARVALLGSGALTPAALQAQETLENDYGVAADVWVATSYQQLHREALDCERATRLAPKAKARKPYVTRCLEDAGDAVVATSDNLKALPYLIAPWVPQGMTALGTDGFGRSETREALRDFFEVDHRYVTVAALERLARAGKIDRKVVVKAAKDLDIDAGKPDPTRT